MAYVKILYQDSPSTATPLNAQNLNHMDDQIALNDQRLTDLEGAHVSSFNGRTGAVTPADGDYDIGQIAPLSGAQVGQVPVVVNHGTEQDPELVFEMGAGGGGGHSIIDSSGNTMPQETAMQFPDSFISDDNVNGRTVVENIKEVATADYPSETEDGMYLISDGEGAVIEPASDDKVEVTADGVKTYDTLLGELHNKITDYEKITYITTLKIGNNHFRLWARDGQNLYFTAPTASGSSPYVHVTEVALSYGGNSYYTVSENTAPTNYLTTIPSNGTKITLYYGNKKATVDLQTTANRCWMSEGESVQDVLTMTSGTCDASRIPNLTSGSVKWVKYGKLVILIADSLYFSDQTSSLKTHVVSLSDLGAPPCNMPSSTRINGASIENGVLSGQLWLTPTSIDFRTISTNMGIYGQVMYFTA